MEESARRAAIGPRIGRPHGFKQCDQMLAGGFFVPFAVAPHGLEKCLYSAIAIALGV